jgi:excisionase family DNA binding protein
MKKSPTPTEGHASPVTKSLDAPLRLALSVDQSAVAISVSPRTIRTLIRKGELKSLLIGRRRLLSTETLQSFVKARERESA